MKHYLFLLFFILSYNNFAQETSQENQDDLVLDYSKIDVKPEFPGGMKTFHTIFMKNVKIPDVEKLKGKIIVTFIIEKDGTVTNMKVKEDVGYGTGEDTIRVLKSCFNWKPGEHNGKIVRTSHQIKINIENGG